jgi:hypothetical protein
VVLLAVKSEPVVAENHDAIEISGIGFGTGGIGCDGAADRAGRDALYLTPRCVAWRHCVGGLMPWMQLSFKPSRIGWR